MGVAQRLKDDPAPRGGRGGQRARDGLRRRRADVCRDGRRVHRLHGLCIAKQRRPRIRAHDAVRLEPVCRLERGDGGKRIVAEGVVRRGVQVPERHQPLLDRLHVRAGREPPQQPRIGGRVRGRGPLRLRGRARSHAAKQRRPRIRADDAVRLEPVCRLERGDGGKRIVAEGVVRRGVQVPERRQPLLDRLHVRPLHHVLEQSRICHGRFPPQF